MASVMYVWQKVKKAPSKLMYHSVTFSNGEIHKKEFELTDSKKNEKCFVLPSEIGQIPIITYDSYKKTLKLRLEEIDF